MEAWGRFGWLSRAIVLAGAVSLVFAATAHAELEFLTQWGAPQNGELISPISVDIDTAGNSYVADASTSSVQKFDPNGVFVQRFGTPGSGPGQLSFPTAVAVDSSSGNVYVADLTGLDDPATFNVRIERFDASGNFLGQFGSFGTAEGQFGSVNGISVYAGAVYVADGGNNRVQRFNTVGGFHRMWGRDVNPGGGTGPEICTSGCKKGELGSTEGEFAGLNDVAAGSFGVMVTEDENNRIQRFDANGAFQVMGGKDVNPGGGTGAETCTVGCKAGLSGTGDGELDTPEGLDVDSVFGFVLVADSGNHRVQRWNPGLTYASQFGSQGSGDGQFELPFGLAESGGRVVVVDLLLIRAQRFTLAGTFQQRFGEPAASTLVYPLLGRPTGGLEAGPGGIYVTDTRARVVRFDSGGGFLGTWGSPGSAVGQFDGPEGLAVDPGGEVYVADGNNERIQRFDANGAELGTWGSPGGAAGQFSSLHDLAAGANGTIYSVEGTGDRVQAFTNIGGFLGTWGAPGTGNGQFSGPGGIATDAGGNIYVVDTGNDRIEKFDPTGAFVTTWGSTGTGDGQFNDPAGIAVDGAGYVYVADRGNNRIQRFDATGAFLSRFGANGGDGSAGGGPGEFRGPKAVAVDASGNVYVLDLGNSRVEKFAPATAPPPELTLAGRKRQKPARLRVRVDCGPAPCILKLTGKATARAGHYGKRRKLTRALVPKTVGLAAGEKRTLKLKLKKGKRTVRAIKRLLKAGGRGKVVVRATATNSGGADSAKLKLKLKR